MVLGKGITFDSGGLNIKGTGFMEVRGSKREKKAELTWL